MSQGLGVVVVFCGVWRRLRLRFVAGGAFDPLKEGAENLRARSWGRWVVVDGSLQTYT